MEYRKFNNKRYHLWDRYTLKSYAKSDAAKARKQGKQARVVHEVKRGAIGTWAIYVREK